MATMSSRRFGANIAEQLAETLTDDEAVTFIAAAYRVTPISGTVTRQPTETGFVTFTFDIEDD